MVRVSRRVGWATASLSRGTPRQRSDPRTNGYQTQRREGSRFRAEPKGQKAANSTGRRLGRQSSRMSHQRAVTPRPPKRPRSPSRQRFPADRCIRTRPAHDEKCTASPPVDPGSRGIGRVSPTILRPPEPPNRPTAESRRGTPRGPNRFLSERFHVLLNSLFKVLFNVPSRYLFAIGLAMVFSLRWSLPPALGCILKQPDSGDQLRTGFRRPHGADTLYGQDQRSRGFGPSSTRA